jgi:hypothetical protein
VKYDYEQRLRDCVQFALTLKDGVVSRVDSGAKNTVSVTVSSRAVSRLVRFNSPAVLTVVV